jgi:hypothetical protein
MEQLSGRLAVGLLLPEFRVGCGEVRAAAQIGIVDDERSERAQIRFRRLSPL